MASMNGTKRGVPCTGPTTTPEAFMRRGGSSITERDTSKSLTDFGTGSASGALLSLQIAEPPTLRSNCELEDLSVHALMGMAVLTIARHLPKSHGRFLVAS